MEPSFDSLSLVLGCVDTITGNLYNFAILFNTLISGLDYFYCQHFLACETIQQIIIFFRPKSDKIFDEFILSKFLYNLVHRRTC